MGVALMGIIVAIFILVCAAVGLVIGLCWRSFITVTIWNWFMPIIFGLPYVTFWQAVGLNLVAASLLLVMKPPAKKMSEKDIGKMAKNSFIGMFLYGGMILLMGYIAKCYMGV